MTYFLKRNLATGDSIRVHTWTGNQFLPKDIAIASIEKFGDSEVLLATELPSAVQSAIYTSDGAFFIIESVDQLVTRLYEHLFNPPTLGIRPSRRERM